MFKMSFFFWHTLYICASGQKPDQNCTTCETLDDIPHQLCCELSMKIYWYNQISNSYRT